MSRSDSSGAETRFLKDQREAAEIQIAECFARQRGTIHFPRVRQEEQKFLTLVDYVLVNGDRPLGVRKALWRELLVSAVIEMHQQDKLTFGRRGTTVTMAGGYRFSVVRRAERQRESGRKQYVGKGRKPQYMKRPQRRRFDPQLA